MFLSDTTIIWNKSLFRTHILLQWESNSLYFTLKENFSTEGKKKKIILGVRTKKLYHIFTIFQSSSTQSSSLRGSLWVCFVFIRYFVIIFFLIFETFVLKEIKICFLKAKHIHTVLCWTTYKIWGASCNRHICAFVFW